MLSQIKTWSNQNYGQEKFLVISFHTAPTVAQNALLKVFEEPTEGTKFVVVTSHLHGLLPTVRSRLCILNLEQTSPSTTSEASKVFFSTAPAKRMESSVVEEVLAKKDEEDRADREAASAFVAQLFSYSMEKRLLSQSEKILECLRYMQSPSSSPKMLLEYLSLMLPVVK
jgi:hypothetical protein